MLSKLQRAKREQPINKGIIIGVQIRIKGNRQKARMGGQVCSLYFKACS